MPADLNYLLQARRNRYTQPTGGSRTASVEDPRAAIEEAAYRAESKRLALAAKEQEAAAEDAAKAYEKGQADAEKEAKRVRNNEMELQARREKRPIYTDADGLIQSQYSDEEWQAQKERKAKNDALRVKYFKEQRPWVEDAEGNMVPRHTDEQWQALQAEKVAKDKAEAFDAAAKDWREQKGAALTAVDDQTAQVMRGLDLEGQDLGLKHRFKLETVKKANAQIKMLEAEIENGETEAGQILDGAAIAKRTAARAALVAERDRVQAEADAADALVRAHEVRKLEYSRANNEVQGWLQREKRGLKTAMPPVVMGVRGAEGAGTKGGFDFGKGMKEQGNGDRSRNSLGGGSGDVRPEPAEAGTTIPGTGVQSTEAVRKAVIEGRISALAEDDSLSDEERRARLTKLMLQRDDPAAYETQVLQEFEGLEPEALNQALDGQMQDFEQRKVDWQARRDALRQQTQAVNGEVDGVLARNAQRLQQPHKAADLIPYTTGDGTTVNVFKDLAPQLEQALEKTGTFEKHNQSEMDRIDAEAGELERAAKLIQAGGGVLQKKQEAARGVAKAERQKVYEQLNSLPGAKLGDELAQVDAAVEKHQGGDDVSLQEWAGKEREKIAAKAEQMQKKLGPAIEQAYAAAAQKMPAGVDLNAEFDRDPLAVETEAAGQGVESLLDGLGMAKTKENRVQAVKMLRDAALLDWSRGDTEAPVRMDSAGRVLVNPERWTDDEAYAAAVAGAGASEAEKAKALEMQPELKAQAIKLKLDTLRPLGVFRDWEEAEVPPTREEKMEALANGRQPQPRKLHEGLSDEEKLKLFEKENSGVFSTGAWKVRWNQALLGAAQGVLGLAQSATGIASVVSDDALKLNQSLGRDVAQMSAESQALPTGQWVNQGASMLVSSAPALGVGGAVGAATRSEMLALQSAAAAAGAQTFGQVYGDAVQGYRENRGLSTAEARKAALVPALASGVATYALTAAGGVNGMESVLRQPGFKQGLKQWLTTVGKGALKEGALEEAPDQLIQGVIQRHSYDPTKSWSSIWEETVTAAIAGAVMGGGFEMMSGGGRDGRADFGKGMKEQGNGPDLDGAGQGMASQTGAGDELAGVGDVRPEPPKGGTTILRTGNGGQSRSQLQTGAPSTEGGDGGQSSRKLEARTTEAEAELAGFAPAGMSAATVAATKAKAEVLLRLAQGETLEDFPDEELRQVGLNRDGTPGHYESVPLDKKDPQAGRTSVWKKGVRPDGFQPVVIEDGEVIITQRQIDNLGKRLPAVAARIGKSEVERRREIKELKTVAEGRASPPLTVVDGGLQKPEGKPEQKPNTEGTLTNERGRVDGDTAAIAGKDAGRAGAEMAAGAGIQAARGVAAAGGDSAVGGGAGNVRPEPPEGGTTILSEAGGQSRSKPEARATEEAFDPTVEARVDEIGAELASRGLSGEQALRAARGVVRRMGVMGPRYEVQMIDPAFEEAMKAEGFQRDPAKMSRWMVRGQFKAETRAEKPVMRRAEGAGTKDALVSGKGMKEQGNGGTGTGVGQGLAGQTGAGDELVGGGDVRPEPPEGGTTILSEAGGQSRSQLQTGAPSTEGGDRSQSSRTPEARAAGALIERGDWKRAQGEVIAGMQSLAKGLPESGKKAAAERIKGVVRRFNKVEELIDTKFGRLFEGVTIVPNGSLPGGGMAAQVIDYDAQGRATGVELLVDPATFAEAGGITDAELERALNEEWQHRADLMVMSRSEAIDLARDIHAAQPGVFNAAWKQYFAVGIKDGSVPAKPPADLTDDEAYMLYFEASRMIRQGTFTSENAAIRDVGLLQRMYLMLSRYVNFVRREMNKLPQDLRELWEDRLTAAEAVMRKTKEAGIRLQKEGLDDVEPPESAQPKKVKEKEKTKPVNEDEAALAMAADAEMDVRPERKGALRNPSENAIRGMAAIPDPDNGKENVVVWINRYHGRITRPSEGWLARMAQDGKDRRKIGDWDDIRQAEIPRFYAGLVFKNGNGSTLDQALQELHGAGYFPGVAEEDVTGEMLARKIKDVIKRYQAKKQGGATTVQDEEQAYFARLERQRVAFERSTAKGPIYIKPHEMQPGDVMMVKADDGKMHRVEVLRMDSEPVPAGEEFDPDANPAQFMGPDGPMQIQSVTLRDGTTFGVQTIDGQQGLYVDAFSVNQKGDFYAGLGSPRKQAGPGLFGEDEMNFLGDRNTLGLGEQSGRKDVAVSGKGMKEQGNAGTGAGQDSSISGLPDFKIPRYWIDDEGNVRQAKKVFGIEGGTGISKLSWKRKPSHTVLFKGPRAKAEQWIQEQGGKLLSNDAAPTGDFSLEATTPAELKAEAERKVLREKLQARAEKPLVGTMGDIGQTQMFGGGDLFAQPGRLSSARKQTEAGKRWAVKNAGNEQDSEFQALFSPRKQAGNAFYSKLAQVIEQKMPNRADAKTVVGIVSNPSSAVKAEELKWSGIVPWVQQQAEPVSKAAVLEYLRTDGAVRLEEVRLGGSQTNLEDANRAVIAQARAEGMTQSGAEYYALSAARGELSKGQEELMSSEMRPLVARVRASYQARAAEYAAGQSQPKFSQYQLPGGENYREVVLAMPPVVEEYTGFNTKVLEQDDPLVQEQSKDSQTRFWFIQAPGQVFQIARAKYPNAGDALSYVLREKQPEPSPATNYTSRHFGNVPNYVAHMRLNDRRDADGQAGTFIEEIQSDRHQEGREKGYRGELTPAFQEYLRQLPEAVRADALHLYHAPSATTHESGPYWRRLETAAPDTDHNLIHDEREKTEETIPDAPFRTTWPLQMFKRALADAVSDGKQWIGWTTGETQAERYDLSQQIDAIKYLKTGDTYTLTAEKGSETLIEREGLSPTEVSDLVGKDIAQKIINGEGESTENEDYPGVKQLSGEGLKVGGEGMKGFYDQILPKEIGKYVKQWGAGVQKAELIGSGNPMWSSLEQFADEVYPGAAIDDDLRAAYARAKYTKASATPFWKVEVTPAMRDGVKAGQALFSARKQKPILETIEQVQEWHQAQNKGEAVDQLPEDLRAKIEADERWQWLQEHDASEEFAPWYPEPYRAASQAYADFSARQEADEELTAAEEKAMEKAQDKLLRWEMDGGPWNHVVATYEPEIEARMKEVIAQIEATGRWEWDAKEDEFVATDEDNAQVLYSARKQGVARPEPPKGGTTLLRTGARATGVDRAAHEAATSPRNDLPEPTAAQKEAGNYAKGHVSIGGHEISIENPAGSRRRPEWPVLRDHYGYLKGTKGADGDQVDVFVKPGTLADYAGPVFVVRQNVVEEEPLTVAEGRRPPLTVVDGGLQNPRQKWKATGKLDEYKVMLGYATAEEARGAYLRNYTPGWPGLAKLTTHTMPEFEVIKRSVFGGDVGARATDKALASARKQGQGGGMADPDKAARNAEPSPGGLSEAEAKYFGPLYFGNRTEGQQIDDIGDSIFLTDNLNAAKDYAHSNNVPQAFYITGKVASVDDLDIDWSAYRWNEYHLEEGSGTDDLDLGALLANKNHRRTVAHQLRKQGFTALKFSGDVSSYGQIEHDSWLVADSKKIKRAEVNPDSLTLSRAVGGTLAAPRKQWKVNELLAKADWGRIDKALTGRLAAAVTDAARWIKKQALPGEAQVNPVDAALELLAGWSVEGQIAESGAKMKPAQRDELMAQTRRQMRRFWNYGVRQLVPDASLPADVLAKKREMTMNQGLSNEVALDIGKRALAGKPKLSDLVVGEAQQNPEVRRKMFLAMNPKIDSGVTMASLNPEERRVAEALLKLRDELGQRMVRAGRIGLQTYEAMREGTSHYYDHDVKKEKSLLRQMSLGLRNLFAQTATAFHIVDTQTKQPDGSPALVMHPGSRNRPTYRFDTQEQMRGFYEEFIKDHILQAAEKGNAGRYPWMTPADKAALMGVTRDSLNNPGRMSADQRAVVARLQEQLRDRFEKRVPLTYDEHSKAGLIEDPFYSVARQIAEMGHDVATAEFFNSIAAVPDYVRDAPTIGYTEMPDTAKLGALAGKYVRDDVAAEVQQLTELPGMGMKFYDALLGLFKTGKTVLNPGSHGRNVVGNIAFAHMAGSNPLNPGNWAYYTDALRVLREGGAEYREMYEKGVLGGDFLTGEIKRSLRQLVPDAATVLREAENGNMSWLFGLKEHMARRWQGLLKTPGKALDIAATAWRLEDDIYKAAAYLKAKSMGMSSTEAAEHVREWFPYYDKGTSGTLKFLGRFAFPFLSFKRESFRILKNGLTKKPLATIATLALPRLLTQIALTMAEMRLLMWTLGLGLKDERDKEDVMKALKGRAGRLLSPIAGDTSLFSILLPFRDGNGGLQQWDLSNTHPFGDWLATRIEDAESREPWLARQAREMLTGSPFLGLLTETAFNKDSFTGRRIYEDDMSSGEATGKLVEHAFTELAPPITPTVSLPGGVKLEGTSARTIRKAFEQSPSKLAPARNPTQAVIRTLVGLDVRPADPNLYEDVAEYRVKNNLPAVPRGQQFPTDAVGRARAELYRLLIQPKVDVPAVKAQLDVLAKNGAKIPSVQDLFKDRQPQDVMKLKKHQQRWMNQLAPEARRVLEAAQKQQTGAKAGALDAMAKARAGG